MNELPALDCGFWTDILLCSMAVSIEVEDVGTLGPSNPTCYGLGCDPTKFLDPYSNPTGMGFIDVANNWVWKKPWVWCLCDDISDLARRGTSLSPPYHTNRRHCWQTMESTFTGDPEAPKLWENIFLLFQFPRLLSVMAVQVGQDIVYIMLCIIYNII